MAVLSSGVALGVLAVCVPALAQTARTANVADPQTVEAARSERSTVLDRIVIGAGAEKVAIDTPQAVTVLDQADIDATQAATVGDFFRQVPGVSVSGSERALGETFNIRGIGAPESAGDEGRIIINVDGVPKFYESYRLGSFFSEPELYKRVEVLRGPASSTLYGSGALGGVVNFTTKDAGDFLKDGQTTALRLKGMWDSNPNGWLGSAIVAHRLGEHVELLLAGNYRNYGDYTTGNGETRDSSFDAPSGLAKATIRFGENNEQAVRLSYQHWTSDGDGVPLSQTTSDPTTDATFGFVDRIVTDRTAILSYENPASSNDNLDLKLTASYSNTTNEQSNARQPNGAPQPPTTIWQDVTYGYETWQVSGQNTFDRRGETWENHLTIGGQALHQTRSTEVRTPLGFHPEGRDVQFGVFLQNEFVWNDRLTVIPGVRVDVQRLSPDATVPGASTETDVAFSPKIAAHYRINDMFAVFGSYAHTERLPTLDEVFSNDFASPAPPNYSLGLKKERSNNFELGFSFEAFDLFQDDDALQFKATGFYNDVRDYIERVRNAYPQYRNTGHAVIYGAELELAYDSEHVFGSAGASLVRGENKAPISATNPNGYLNTVAPDEVFFTIGGRIPQHNVSFGWNSRFVAAQDRVVGTATSRPKSKAFDLHGAFVAWAPDTGLLEGYETRFAVENIFDRQYKEYLANDPGRGRTFKLTLARTFGW